jgi:hypothetical protein
VNALLSAVAIRDTEGGLVHCQLAITDISARTKAEDGLRKLALAALDIRAHGTEAVRALERSVAANADSHVERVMQARAVELLRVLQGDRKQAQRLAQQLL